MYITENIYGDPGNDQAALDTMTKIYNILNNIKAQCNPKIILGDDFNTTLEDRDSTGPQPKPRAANKLLHIITHMDQYDVAAHTSHLPRHTYFQHNNENTHFRWDKFYVLEDMTQTALKTIRSSSYLTGF